MRDTKFDLTEEESLIAKQNKDLIKAKAQFLLENIPRKAVAMARKQIAVQILRKDNPLYGHTEESLNDEYAYLKSIEDAESGADRESCYQGTNELDLTTEEIKTYVLKHSM
ncbi:MAG: hypothetical protein [Circular genetic element sp.]|nr:MAG: hypothetical protein [Circular genetic element sp.]